MSKRKSNKVVPGDPSKKLHFTTWLRSLDGELMLVTLTAAAGDEECPLTLDPISSDSLGCLPGVTFMKNEPTVRKMTLPCGHAFGAMNVLYYFARRKMQCPCCRAGVDDLIDPDCIPAHFRMPMTARVVEEQRKEIQEELANDELVALQHSLGVMGTTATPELLQLLQSRPVVMMTDAELSVYVHDLPSGDVGVSFQFPLHLAVEEMQAGSDAVFELRLQDRRTLSRFVTELGLRHVSLVVHARPHGGAVAELARCEPFPVDGGAQLSALPRTPLMHLPPQIVLAGPTAFEIVRHAETLNILSLRWVASLEALQRMMPAVRIRSIQDEIRRLAATAGR